MQPGAFTIVGSEISALVGLVEAAFQTDHQAAFLGVEAAKSGGRLDDEAAVGELH